MQNEDVPLHSCKHFAPDIRKKTFCHNYPGLINELARGFRMAMQQCETEMSGERYSTLLFFFIHKILQMGLSDNSKYKRPNNTNGHQPVRFDARYR